MTLDLATLDGFVSDHGHFCLLDWLLAEGLLPYQDYEAWRHGQRSELEGAIALAPAELDALFEQADDLCRRLKLECETQGYYRWDGQSQQPLSASNKPQTHRALLQRWAPRQDAPQMDLFLDNTATLTENQLHRLLAARQFDSAQHCLHRLIELNNSHPKLGGYQDLINYGAHIGGNPEIAPADLEAERLGLLTEVAPLASELLGAASRDYLAFAWRRLADNLARRPFAPDRPDSHASAALARIPDWQALVHNLENEPELYQSAELLARLATGYRHTQRPQLHDLIWVLLFERFADTGERLIVSQGRALTPFWDDFWELDEDIPAGQFAAYLLLREPGLLRWLDRLPDQAGGGLVADTSRTVMRLLEARRTGADEKPHRAALMQQSPTLLKSYLTHV